MKLQHLNRPLQLKAVSENGHFSGYGSVFDVVDQHFDIVERGAFSKSLDLHKSKGTMPAFLWQHKSDEPIGVFTQMYEDSHGLYLEGEIAVKTQRGAEAYELMKMGAVNGLSIGFTIPKGGDKYDSKLGVNRLSEIDLWETSIVTFPANPDSLIGEVKQATESKTELERFLRNAGMSRSQARALIAGGYNYLNPRQAEADSVANLGAKAKSLHASILKSLQR